MLTLSFIIITCQDPNTIFLLGQKSSHLRHSACLTLDSSLAVPQITWDPKMPSSRPLIRFFQFAFWFHCWMDTMMLLDGLGELHFSFFKLGIYVFWFVAEKILELEKFFFFSWFSSVLLRNCRKREEKETFFACLFVFLLPEFRHFYWKTWEILVLKSNVLAWCPREEICSILPELHMNLGS